METEPLRDDFGSIIPPMPSNPVQPSSEIYGQGCILGLVGDESDPVAQPKLTLLAKSHDGTMPNNTTRLVHCTILKGPRRLVGLDVVAIVYDPLYVPLYCLPLLPPENFQVADGPENENAQGDEKREDKEHDEESINGTGKVEPKSWTDYLPPPNPLVTPPTTEALTDQAQLWDRKIQSRAAYAKDFFTKELKCYKKLEQHQGRMIPAFLGSYTISFPDREHEEDKTVHVLFVESVTRTVSINLGYVLLL
jgi:hypothetical protein